MYVYMYAQICICAYVENWRDRETIRLYFKYIVDRTAFRVVSRMQAHMRNATCDATRGGQRKETGVREQNLKMSGKSLGGRAPRPSAPVGRVSDLTWLKLLSSSRESYTLARRIIDVIGACFGKIRAIDREIITLGVQCRMLYRRGTRR